MSMVLSSQTAKITARHRGIPDVAACWGKSSLVRLQRKLRGEIPRFDPIGNGVLRPDDHDRYDF